MGKNNNTIQINGRHYDAVTGKTLSSQSKSATAKVTPKATKKPVNVKVKGPASQNNLNRAVKSPPGHKQQPARTLMRHAVNKPAASLKRRLRAYNRADVLAKQPELTVTPKASIQVLDAKRLRHAKQIRKSRLISRFGPYQTAQPADAPSYVAPAPAKQPVAARRPTKASPPNKQPAATADLLQHALDQATSHLQQPPPKRRRFRLHKRNAKN